jgi:hypothetical protein
MTSHQYRGTCEHGYPDYPQNPQVIYSVTYKAGRARTRRGHCRWAAPSTSRMECASRFHQLVSHNDDLKQLLEKGYAIKFDSGHLVVRDIPYLDKDKVCQVGAIVTKLTFVDQVRIARPDDHQVFF